MSHNEHFMKGIPKARSHSYTTQGKDSFASHSGNSVGIYTRQYPSGISMVLLCEIETR
ncbi:hypothetical protein I79_012771 [Cricetulus griseus]|uniref:Uncharacterized protein n=1 Tax=Cricetulus griseus TaxID=10029 RepID=G3HPQ4_CRIGR|nr:hypothetical protein I79_012771 [Cricetulus griseus]